MIYLQSILIFAFLGAGLLVHRDEALLTIPITIVGAIIYFVYYLYKIGAIKEILIGILKSLLILLCALIPVIGIVILVGFVIYNVIKSLQFLRQMLPEIIFSFAIYAALAGALLLKYQGNPWFYAPAALYALLALAYTAKLAQQERSTALFKMSFMLLSLPIAWVTIVAAVQSLANMLRITVSTLGRPTVITQNVAGYVRTSGTVVDAYTRSVTQVLPETITQVTAGTGAVTSAVLKESAKKIANETEAPH